MTGRVISVLLCLVVTLASSCSDEPPAQPTHTPTVDTVLVSPVPQATPTVSFVPTRAPSTAHPAGVRTGVPNVDRVIEAVESRQASRISDLMQFFSWPCSRAPQNGGILGCRDGEADGAESMVVAWAGCEGGFARRGEIGESINHWLAENNAGLHAIIEVQPVPQAPFRGTTVIVYANGQTLEVGSAGITLLDFSCVELNGEDRVKDLQTSRGPTRFLLPPVGASASPAISSPVASPPPSPALNSHQRGTRTGVAKIDEVLTAVESRDDLTLATLLHYFPWPCTNATGIGALPCAEGEPEGTQVNVIAVSGCEGGFQRTSIGPEVAANFLEFNDERLYAVLKLLPNRAGERIPGDYVILYTNGQTLGVDTGGVTNLHFSCGGDAANWIKNQQQAGIAIDYLLPPPK